jgi:uncharacterized repeat protein (TIGR03803 family)
MRGKRFSVGLKATLAVFTVTLFVTGIAASQEKVLHSFNKTDGANPYASLISDHAGNLYGTTYAGGAYGYGTAFELRPKSGGGWTEKVLHSFNNNGTDGYNPYASLIFDASGNLYATTYYGGSGSCINGTVVVGCGTVFELTPQAGGSWKETVLHNFDDNGTDGFYPYAGLTFDSAGGLYGTTEWGGTGVYGTVFELTPAAGGSWTESVLHNFSDNGTDGYFPEAGLIFDAVGNLYGTTEWGGTGVYGTVFELMPTAGGTWTETVLHNFSVNGTDGDLPLGGLIFDAAGNLYGTTYEGGVYDSDGTVFELTFTASGSWTETVLHNFDDNDVDGYLPEGGLILDASGNLYGTTVAGGNLLKGTVFELTPTAGGSWTEKVLHNFSDNGKDGENPYAGLISDAAGNLYGTTYEGGAYGYGTVFEIKH